MKKTNLRKIIRESIKELMDAQHLSNNVGPHTHRRGSGDCIKCCKDHNGMISQLLPTTDPCGCPLGKVEVPCNGPSYTCSQIDFETASVMGTPSAFINLIWNKFSVHPDGCRYLDRILTKNMGHGASGISGTGVQMGANWSAQKAAKIYTLQAIINQCCNNTSGSNDTNPIQGA